MDETSELQTTPVQIGAGFGIRAAARIIDTIYGLGLGFIGGFLAAIALLVLDFWLRGRSLM